MNQNIHSMYIGETADTEHCYFTTVKEMEIQYLALNRKCAVRVWCIQERQGFSSDIGLANAINYNIFGTCHFNRRDIQIVKKIYGPSVVAVKGKSTKQQNKMKCSDIFTNIPKEILDAYGKIHLDIDIMFMNKCGYFTAILQHIGLIYCCVIASRANKWVMNVMQRIIEQYNKRGFTVSIVHGDNKFTWKRCF